MFKKFVSAVLLLSLAVCFPGCGRGEKSGAKTYPWPADAFFGDIIPPAAEQVNYVEKIGDKGFRRVVIYIDDYSYEDFLKYVDKLEYAGCVEFFDKNSVYPEEPSKERAMFASNTLEGACVVVFWYPRDYRGYEHSLTMQITEYDAISQ